MESKAWNFNAEMQRAQRSAEFGVIEPGLFEFTSLISALLCVLTSPRFSGWVLVYPIGGTAQRPSIMLAFTLPVWARTVS